MSRAFLVSTRPEHLIQIGTPHRFPIIMNSFSVYDTVHLLGSILLFHQLIVDPFIVINGSF